MLKSPVCLVQTGRLPAFWAVKVQDRPQLGSQCTCHQRLPSVRWGIDTGAPELSLATWAHHDSTDAQEGLPSAEQQ